MQLPAVGSCTRCFGRQGRAMEAAPAQPHKQRRLLAQAAQAMPAVLRPCPLQPRLLQASGLASAPASGLALHHALLDALHKLALLRLKLRARGLHWYDSENWVGDYARRACALSSFTTASKLHHVEPLHALMLMCG